MNDDVKTSIQRGIAAPLVEAMKSLEVSNESVLRVWRDILQGDGQDSNRLRAVELYVKWLGLAAPDKLEISEVSIGAELPDDLDM